MIAGREPGKAPWAAILFAALVFHASASCQALDLYPHRRGTIMQTAGNYYFQDGDKRIGFRVDPKTTVSGSPSEALFIFGDLPMEEMRMTHSALKPSIGFDGQGLKQYEEAARGTIPAGVTKAVQKEVPGAITIEGWTSHQFVFTYNFYGVEITRSVTFLNYSKKQQLQIVITAPAHDYEKCYRRAFLILNSLYEIQEGEENQGA